ncbi:hypothetical protein D3C75_1144730 [compost metagenome]
MIIANNLKGHLIHNLTHYRIHLARHDGRTRLPGRKLNFSQTGPWPRSHETQIVGYFGHIDHSDLERSRDLRIGIRILGGIGQMCCVL